MNENKTIYLHCQVVEEEVSLTLAELSRTCGVSEEHVTTWVFEGVLEPAGPQPQDWQFDGSSLRRARMASRLSQDLELNPAGIALALDLLDEISNLRVQLGRSRKT